MKPEYDYDCFWDKKDLEENGPCFVTAGSPIAAALIFAEGEEIDYGTVSAGHHTVHVRPHDGSGEIACRVWKNYDEDDGSHLNWTMRARELELA